MAVVLQKNGLSATDTFHMVILIQTCILKGKDVFFNYQRTRQLPSAASSKMRKEANRHDRGLQIPASDVQV